MIITTDTKLNCSKECCSGTRHGPGSNCNGGITFGCLLSGAAASRVSLSPRQAVTAVWAGTGRQPAVAPPVLGSVQFKLPPLDRGVTDCWTVRGKATKKLENASSGKFSTNWAGVRKA